MRPIFIYLIILAGMSLIAFILYGVDKGRARRGAWRIRESVLLGFGLLGGAIGAILGMKVFHHKTKHWYFWAVNIAALLLQAVLAYLILRIK